MAIPFTQYLLPDGRKRAEVISRPADIEALAKKFIASGGRYECEMLRTGHVSLTAVAEVDGEEDDIECIVCNNGPDVPAKVDELVRRSVTHIGATP
jgi:hypothetical protein